MTKRRLTPDELALWQDVARTTIRHSPVRKAVIDEAPQSLRTAPIKAKPTTTPTAIPNFKIGSGAKPTHEFRDVAAPLKSRLQDAPLRMDRKSFKTMNRGKLKPEARIDLHGMTVAQAHPALNTFIHSAHNSGKRLVLVITGKGGRRADDAPFSQPGMGALKRQVPHWLAQSPLSHIVLQVNEAHLRHGGSGAYYVYLKRGR